MLVIPVMLFFLKEVMEKLQSAQEGQSTLQAECEQYRSVLAETVRLYFSMCFCQALMELGLTWFTSCCYTGRNAKNPSEECGGGGGGVEIQDNGIRGANEDGRSAFCIYTHTSI